MCSTRNPSGREPVDRAAYRKSLDKLHGVLGQIVRHADVQARTRCPYKNRFGSCTAGFGCTYQRGPRAGGELPICGSDHRLNCRHAWETDAGRSKNAGSVSYNGRRSAATIGKTLFDHCDELGVKVPSSCGRTGSCHECIVEVRGGMEGLSPRSEAEAFLNDRHRLACQATVETADHEIRFGLLRRASRILTAQIRRDVAHDPMVTRKGDRVYYDREEIDVYRGALYGLAVDVGTTTVVAELSDLETGQAMHLTAFDNPQRFGGSDVMHRISYDGGRFRGELRRAIISTLNAEIAAMCARLGVHRNLIYEIVVVGNSAMRDLFFGLDVQPIGERPYKSVTELAYQQGRRHTTALTSEARGLGIRVHEKARVFGAPLIASHVGADAVANLVAIDMASQRDVVMVVDVGTNTEVILGHKDKLITASCPAGPAFEGGGVKFGMPGYEGAIESIRYVDGRFHCKVIGGGEPAGICGSGLIELLAELRRHNRMTPKGVFADKAREFCIVPECGITFSRQDASELAQAKAANFCGQRILMRALGVRPEQISKLYLAGGFANYVDAASAVEIGFLAPVPVDRVVKVGNAAAQGAREMLLSRGKRAAIEQLIKKIEHVELETTPDFFETFVEGCQFKPM